VTGPDSAPNTSDRWSIVLVDPVAWAVIAGNRPAADSDAIFTDDLAMVQTLDDPDGTLLNYLQLPARTTGIVACGSESSGKVS
jgi:hypothetical protein